MSEKDYEDIFKIILSAGDAKSLASESIDLLEEYDFESAEEKLREARSNLVECHNLQTKFLNDEASGNGDKLNIFMVHAQDHFSMATSSIELAERMKKVYKKLKNMEEKNEKSINNV